MCKAIEYIKKFTRHCDNKLIGFRKPRYHSWVTPDDALVAIQLAKKEAIKWVKENAPKYHWYDPIEDNEGVRWDDMVKDMKKALK